MSVKPVQAHSADDVLGHPARLARTGTSGRMLHVKVPVR
jgi:hypothetical protein